MRRVNMFSKNNKKSRKSKGIRMVELRPSLLILVLIQLQKYRLPFSNKQNTCQIPTAENSKWRNNKSCLKRKRSFTRLHLNL